MYALGKPRWRKPRRHLSEREVVELTLDGRIYIMPARLTECARRENEAADGKRASSERSEQRVALRKAKPAKFRDGGRAAHCPARLFARSNPSVHGQRAR